MNFPVLKPSGQVDFYVRLLAVRGRYLSDALKKTLDDRAFDLHRLNSELAALAGADHLKRLASFGLRGEIFLPAPYLLSRSPYLLGYYRLLYGFSASRFTIQAHSSVSNLWRIQESFTNGWSP